MRNPGLRIIMRFSTTLTRRLRTSTRTFNSTPKSENNNANADKALKELRRFYATNFLKRCDILPIDNGCSPTVLMMQGTSKFGAQLAWRVGQAREQEVKRTQFVDLSNGEPRKQENLRIVFGAIDGCHSHGSAIKEKPLLDHFSPFAVEVSLHLFMKALCEFHMQVNSKELVVGRGELPFLTIIQTVEELSKAGFFNRTSRLKRSIPTTEYQLNQGVTTYKALGTSPLLSEKRKFFHFTRPKDPGKKHPAVVSTKAEIVASQIAGILLRYFPVLPRRQDSQPSSWREPSTASPLSLLDNKCLKPSETDSLSKFTMAQIKIASLYLIQGTLSADLSAKTAVSMWNQLFVLALNFELKPHEHLQESHAVIAAGLLRAGTRLPRTTPDFFATPHNERSEVDHFVVNGRSLNAWA